MSQTLRAALLVALALVLFCGCGAAQLDDRYRRSHRGCTGAVDIRERPSEPGVFDASGCGDDVLYRACIGAVSAGTPQAGLTTVRYPSGPSGRSCRLNLRSEAIQRFAHETGCSRDLVQPVDLGGGQLGLTGCGRRQLFVATVGGWVLNSDVPDVPPAAGP